MLDSQKRSFLRGFSDPPFNLQNSALKSGKVLDDKTTKISRRVSDTPFYTNRGSDANNSSKIKPILRREVSDTPFQISKGRPFPDNMTNMPMNTHDKLNRSSKDSRRVVSLDSSAYKKYKESKKKQKKSNRSVSASEGEIQSRIMNRLSFENIDVVNTPLSSLRSCSEYNKVIIKNAQSDLPLEDPKPKTVWSNMFSWPKMFSSSKPRTNRVHFSSVNDEQSYLVESFRFNQANLLEGETYDYGDGGDGGYSAASFSDRYSHREVMAEPNCISFPFLSPRESASRGSFSSTGAAGGRRADSSISRNKSRTGSFSIFHESTVALDYIFGLSHYTNSSIPLMEIELRNLKEPQFIDVYTTDSSNGSERASMSALRLSDLTSDRDSAHTLPRVLSLEDISDINSGVSVVTPTHANHALRRITSLRSLHGDISDSLSNSSHSRHNHLHAHSHGNGGSNTPSGRSGTPTLAQQRSAFELFSVYRWQTYPPVAQHILRIGTDQVRALYPNTRADDFFYESVRIQPFSSGAYLRGMLWAGFCSLFFNVYNFLSWPDLHTAVVDGLSEGVIVMSDNHKVFEMLLFCGLVAQLVLNLLQLPFRMQIHFQCWESSRAVDVDVAINSIRNMLLHDSWFLNKALGNALDLMSLLNMVVSEVYLWVTPHDDPLRSLVVSLCATNLLTLVSRIVVATAFSLSMHDPQVLSDARRRGLSKWDLEVLPTFLFTRPEEVNNEDCSICLGAFELGEMLISLPCDQKHSFHAMCIRQWLQRQNSCPLCQKLV